MKKTLTQIKCLYLEILLLYENRVINLGIIFLCFFFLSCSKDALEDNELKEDNYFISKANSNLIELESNHNFLIFEDSIAVIKTLNALEDSSNSRYFQFLDKYRNLEPEEIIFLLDSLNFNNESYLDFFEE